MGAGKDLALLMIRIASALAFLFHGSAILFGAFGGPGPAGFLGFTPTSLTIAGLVGVGQFFGGGGMFARGFLGGWGGGGWGVGGGAVQKGDIDTRVLIVAGGD